MNILRQVNIHTQILIVSSIPIFVLAYFAFINQSIMAVLAIIVGISVNILYTLSLTKRLNRISSAAMQLSDHRITEKIDVYGNDEVSSVMKEIKNTREKLLEWGDVQISELSNSARLKKALDNVHSCVMMADADRNIIYCNEAVTKMFVNAEKDIQKDLPNFDSKNVIGTNIDQFHKNPAHQREMLDALTETHEAEIVVGGRSMKFISNPVFSDDGKRLGTAVEWFDRTDDVKITSEIQDLVDKASTGDLSQRITSEDKTGTYQSFIDGINQLVDVAENVVNDTMRIFSAMATGDLTERITADYQGSFNKLKIDANDSLDKLSEILNNIKESSGLVSSAASEISQGNLNLSNRTESQASNLEETSASMTEMTSTVQKNADNAKQANDLASHASENAEKGGAVVSNAVSAMADINEASNKIADIIGVIDEIAFQTNLLALNAAVEAARAGDQGRGFAVVASEVRNLAGRSATAAKEIKGLIEDSVNKVEEGTKLVNQSGETLDEIMENVKEVADIISDITVASQEQAVGIEQTNKSIIKMDESTQQNAALVEQVSASAESMSEQSYELSNMVGFFKIDQDNRQDKEQYFLEDRRSADRPWSSVNKSDVVENSIEFEMKDAVGDVSQNHDWEEF